MNDAPLSTLISQNWLSGRYWPSGVAISRLLMAFSSLAEGLLHAHDQVELALALNHLRGRLAADGRFDEGIDVAHVQSVARQFGAVGRDGQAGLSEFAHHGDFGDAGNLCEDVLDLGGLVLEHFRSAPKILTARALFRPVSASSTASSAGCV